MFIHARLRFSAKVSLDTEQELARELTAKFLQKLAEILKSSSELLLLWDPGTSLWKTRSEKAVSIVNLGDNDLINCPPEKIIRVFFCYHRDEGTAPTTYLLITRPGRAIDARDFLIKQNTAPGNTRWIYRFVKTFGDVVCRENDPGGIEVYCNDDTHVLDKLIKSARHLDHNSFG